MIAALAEVVPDDHKAALMADVLNTQPTNLTVRQSCVYPGQGITFRAMAAYREKPWFDYCWLRVTDDQPGSEEDWTDPSEHRMLAQIWGFTKWMGKKYVFVDLFQRVYREEGVNPHPMLRKYKWFVYARRDGRLLPPFYAFEVSSIIATACVFPDPDFEEYPTVSEKQVLYVPSVAELMGSANTLPDESFLPRLPARVTMDDEEDDEEEEGTQERERVHDSDMEL